MEKEYRICVVASEDALDIIAGSDKIEDTKSFVYETAAEELNVELDVLARNSSVTFISSESEDQPGLDEYDMIVHIEGQPSDLEYTTRLMDWTYDKEWITAESGDGKKFRMPFGALKGYLRQSCGIIAGMARARNAATQLCTIYAQTLCDEKHGSFNAGADSVYARTEESLSRVNDDLADAYADAWEKTVIQFGNLVRLEPKLQFSVIGKYLQYDQEKLDRMKRARNLLHFSCANEPDESKDYEFVINALIQIYESNEVLHER